MSKDKNKDAKHWIKRLALQPHPEGGYYRQTYRSELVIAQAALPPGFGGNRAVATAIYFLLEGNDFSAFHRLRSDELWHFYQGGTLVVDVLDPAGEHSRILLGADAEAGEVFQAVVKAGSWFASHLRDPNSFALVGCTVSPGFDFEDFEMATRAELEKNYPQHHALIERLSRESSADVPKPAPIAGFGALPARTKS